MVICMYPSTVEMYDGLNGEEIAIPKSEEFIHRVGPTWFQVDPIRWRVFFWFELALPNKTTIVVMCPTVSGQPSSVC